MRKTVPHVTCAGADARVWITSARSPNRCGLLPKKCVNRWEGWMCSHIHKKKKDTHCMNLHRIMCLVSSACTVFHTLCNA